MSAADEPAWLEIARRDMAAGVKEIPGKRAHKRILEMYDTAGLAHDNDESQAWCGCACGTWLKEAGYQVPKNFYGAKQFETYGMKVPKDQWQPGEIGVCYRSKLRERTWMRHVGLIVGRTKAGAWKVLGGNQGDAVSIVTIADNDMSALRRPVAATVKDLRDAGSTEIKLSDDLVKAGGGAVVTGVGGAAAKEALQTPAEVPIKEAIEYSGLMQQIMEGAQGVWKMVVANPWLVMAVVGGGIALVLARRVRKARVARAAAGAEISSQVAGAG